MSDSCEMPVLVSKVSEMNFESKMIVLRFDRKLSIQLIMLLSILLFLRLWISLVWNRLSNALIMFRSNIVAIFFLNHVACIVFISIWRASSVPLAFRPLMCLRGSSSNSSAAKLMRVVNMLSRALPNVLRRAIDLYVLSWV